VIYDSESNDTIGVWNEKENRIDFAKKEEEEELCSTVPCSDEEDEDEDEEEDKDEDKDEEEVEEEEEKVE
jgi:hypothetical protein